MTVPEIVNLKITDATITEPEKALAIGEVEQVIKNYCSIDRVPEALNYTWANMAVDLIKYNYESNNSGGEVVVDAADISSLKVGDTQIQLGGGSSSRAKVLNSHRPNLDRIVMNYQSQLNKFRRMVW